MKKKVILILFATMFVLLLVGIATLSRPATHMDISVTFQNYTNDATGAQLARFAITNNSDATVRRWKSYHPEFKSQPGVLSTRSIGQRALLAPGEFEFVAVPTPTNGEPWRVVFDISKEGIRSKFSDTFGQLPALPVRARGIPLQLVRGDWLEPARDTNQAPNSPVPQ